MLQHKAEVGDVVQMPVIIAKEERTGLPVMTQGSCFLPEAPYWKGGGMGTVSRGVSLRIKESAEGSTYRGRVEIG